MVLCVAGPADARRDRRHAPRRRSRACRAARAPSRWRRAPAGAGPRFRAVHNESAQTQVQHAVSRARPRRDPDYLALRALVRVLDDGMSTRLHYQICDQKGLAYYGRRARCSRSTTPRCSRSTPPARTPSCPRWSSEAWRCCGRFREELVGEDELDEGQAPVRRRHRSRRYDDLDGLCGWFGGTELFYGPTHAREAGAALARVRRRADAQQVARRVLRARAALGDGGRCAEAPRSRARSRRSSATSRLSADRSRRPASCLLVLLRGRGSLPAFAGGCLRRRTSSAEGQRLLDRLAGLLPDRARSAPRRRWSCLPASVAETGMSKRALSCVLAARSARDQLGLR